MMLTEKLCKKLDAFCLKDISTGVIRAITTFFLAGQVREKPNCWNSSAASPRQTGGKIFLDGKDITRQRVQHRGSDWSFRTWPSSLITR
ncbi:MAG: hypothetical protein R2756_08790 [Bacteroidales bacterium]